MFCLSIQAFPTNQVLTSASSSCKFFPLNQVFLIYSYFVSLIKFSYQIFSQSSFSYPIKFLTPNQVFYTHSSFSHPLIQILLIQNHQIKFCSLKPANYSFSNSNNFLSFIQVFSNTIIYFSPIQILLKFCNFVCITIFS